MDEMDILTVERKDRAMVIWTSVLLPLALLILLFLRQLWSRRHFPPGPLSFPFIGNMWVLGTTLKKDSFIKLAKQYGNMYTMWLGNQPVVMLSGFQTVKEGLVGFSEEFAGRPQCGFYKIFKNQKGSGITFTNGPIWKEQRRIANVTFQNRGMERKSIEAQIEEAASQLVKTFAGSKGQPFDPSLPMFCLTVNMICLLSFGYKFDPEDEKLHRLAHLITYIREHSSGFFHLMFEGLPWLMTLVPGPHKKMVMCFEQIISLVKLEIEDHRQHQSLHEPQDFTDCYLRQIDKRKKDPNSIFNEETLAFIISELFIAGTDTTFATMDWALLLFANHPNVQEKVHKEIEEVFGSSATISYQDQEKMPYTHAVIHEILRAKYSILFPIPRQTTKDVKMQGFHIPKGTIIVPDLLSVLHDPQQWEAPEEFNPNHFLDTEGNFTLPKAFLPFGAGRRICLGEKLVRKELFIVLTSLLRAFHFQHPVGVKKSDQSDVLAMSIHPHPYKICAVPHDVLSESKAKSHI